MGCNCKHNQEAIAYGKKVIAELRQLFIKRMTVDSDTSDRRRKDFNQAIFHYEDDGAVDLWNNECEKFGLSKKNYGQTYQVFDSMDMDMVLKCFDDAAKDWRKSWCDVDNCTRKDGGQ